MKPKNLLFQGMVLLFLLMNILYPIKALAGAKHGLSLFMNSVLPALLPFFAATTMFVRAGLAHRLARFLTPFTRALFRLPGASALAFILCLFGGNPNGSRITSELYEQGLLTQAESERTVALASTAGPIFILSVVAQDMLKAPQFGAMLWVCHILASVATCGVSSLFTKKTGGDAQRPTPRPLQQSASAIFVDSVRDCAAALWGVGSFIIFFTTLIALCDGLFAVMGKPLATVLKPLGFSSAFAQPLLGGLAEMTEGCRAVGALAAPIEQKVPMVCAIMSFGGLSALAQNHLFARKCGVRLTRLALYYGIKGVFGLMFATFAVRFIPAPAAIPAFAARTFDATLLSSASWLCRALAVLLAIGFALWALSTLFSRANGRRAPWRVSP